MKRLFNLLLLLVVSASLYSQYKVDTMCGAKVILDKNNKLLSCYEPQTPGAGDVVFENADKAKSFKFTDKNGAILPYTTSKINEKNDSRGGNGWRF